ncbi:MAG TPA: hypothetical protein VN709_11685 [Terriglobales bacterium]|nr:hypothetical protein [Terriglobales bacterium]
MKNTLRLVTVAAFLLAATFGVRDMAVASTTHAQRTSTVAVAGFHGQLPGNYVGRVNAGGDPFPPID